MLKWDREACGRCGHSRARHADHTDHPCRVRDNNDKCECPSFIPTGYGDAPNEHIWKQKEED